jgi:hypothetical protein
MSYVLKKLGALFLAELLGNIERMIIPLVRKCQYTLEQLQEHDIYHVSLHEPAWDKVCNAWFKLRRPIV